MIKKYIYSLLSVLVIFCSSFTSSWAQPLTESEVERFLDSLPALEQIEPNTSPSIDPSATLQPFTQSLEQLPPGDQRHAAIEKIAKSHGFKQAKDWAQTGDRVIQAYVLMHMGISFEEMERAYSQALQMLETPGLPPEMKQMLSQQLNSESLEQFRSLKNSKPDVPAVKVHEKRLETLVQRP